MTWTSQELREAATRVADSLAARGDASADTAPSLPTVVARFTDDELVTLLADAAALRAEIDAVIAAGAGVVAKRSERELGYGGLAARHGHRSGVELLRSITGSTRSEAVRHVRLGEAMGESDAALTLRETAPGLDAGTAANDPDGPSPTGAAGMPWFEPITRAVTDHVVTPDGASALLRGLGEPNGDCQSTMLREAAVALLSEATGTPADELGKRAQWLRDQIDADGVSERAHKHFDGRKARLGRTSTGARTVWLECDDESGAWFDTIVAAGMRPRRGGPRFVDKAEAEHAEALKNDPRSNDQLVFDLIMGTLRTGALADPGAVFGSRQAGIRVIVTQDELDKRDAEGNLTGTGFLEDTGEAIASATLEHLLCDTATVPITVDGNGCPLDVGREQRLFTAKQRVALAIRDGGCMHPGCDRPPSYAEAHHIDHWFEHHGKTNIKDGVLLCTFHHMHLHNGHWRIQRVGTTYWLHPPEGDTRAPIRLRSKAAWWRSPRTKAS